MVGRQYIEVTEQRLQETEEAIEAQRRYVAGVDDPVAKATATRTLATLEDIRCIMERTRELLESRNA